MLPVRFKYLDPIIKKSEKQFWENWKFEIKQKTHQPNQKTDFWAAITRKKKQRKWDLSGLNRPSRSWDPGVHTRAHTRARTHACTHACTHTYARTHTHTHTRTHARTRTHTHTHTHTHTTHIHTDIFQKPCILIPNNSKYNYNMFLQ